MAVRRNYLTPGSKTKSSGKNRVTPGTKPKSSRAPGGVVGAVVAGVKGLQEAQSRNVSREAGRGGGYTSGSYRATPASPARGRAAASARMAGQAGRKTTTSSSAAGGRKRVTVKAGDTLSAIAKREGVSLAALKQANKGRAVLDRIYSGSKVVIPSKKKK